MSLVRVRALGAGRDGGLGAICTTPMCDEGSSRVEGLRAFWEQLVASRRLPRDSYESAVSGLEAELDEATSWFSDWIPFNPACCTAAEIGRRALVMQQQMAADASRAGGTPVRPGPGPQEDPQDTSTKSLIGRAMFGVFVLGGLWVVLNSKGGRRAA